MSLQQNGSIIGGMFGLDLSALPGNPSSEVIPAFLTKPQVRLATARSAFALLSRTLKPSCAWLPSYLCPVITSGFSDNGVIVKFYPVGSDLRVSEAPWLSEIEQGDIVVFIDYFGFNTWEHIGDEARKRGAWIVEDASQALLNDQFSDHAHYIVLSPRKFVGVPDGGILIQGRDANLPEFECSPAPVSWWFCAVKASVLRREFDLHGGDRSWYDFFQQSEAAAPTEPYGMNDLSNALVSGIDYSSIISRRKANYEYLSFELSDVAIFPRLQAGVVPLGFPIRLPMRDTVRKAFFAEGIYPAIHWSIGGHVSPSFKGSHLLANEILTLPCDQRYGLSDLERMVACFKRSQAVLN